MANHTREPNGNDFKHTVKTPFKDTTDGTVNTHERSVSGGSVSVQSTTKISGVTVGDVTVSGNNSSRNVTVQGGSNGNITTSAGYDTKGRATSLGHADSTSTAITYPTDTAASFKVERTRSNLKQSTTYSGAGMVQSTETRDHNYIIAKSTGSGFDTLGRPTTLAHLAGLSTTNIDHAWFGVEDSTTPLGTVVTNEVDYLGRLDKSTSKFGNSSTHKIENDYVYNGLTNQVKTSATNGASTLPSTTTQCVIKDLLGNVECVQNPTATSTAHMGGGGASLVDTDIIHTPERPEPWRRSFLR